MRNWVELWGKVYKS